MPFRVGPWELALILGIVLIIFGAGKLPQIGGAIGRSMKEFKKGRVEDEAAEEASKVEATKVEPAKEEAK
ncbi:MAG: twin-arginine translocase TatA/TatE family subunit [Chloroflexi bacterium]|nr:twin-arginine translocase TatA/TatE family subunit [Chloroflexota bacterium]MBT7082576.1 twin-arginine translocase TatA/TatE family subunit [Chloroflexota bacterium]MBT7289121.1 twin-arginine translocase TatA/TatE family subunit [Chloroflexota bacterium]